MSCGVTIADADTILWNSVAVAVFRECGAMARELPLVVPKHQGAALICSDEHAVLIDVVNPEQFVEQAAAGIMKLAKDQGLRKRMGVEGKRRLETNFSWNRYHSRMKCIYEEILGR